MARLYGVSGCIMYLRKVLRKGRATTPSPEGPKRVLSRSEMRSLL
jgi:hypothetical protein